MRTGNVVLLLLLATFSAAAAERTIDVGDGVKIRCLDSEAAGTKTPLLLVTGWRMPAEVWAPQLARFGKERRVVAVHPPPPGVSTITPQGNAPEARGHQLDAVAPALQLE